MLILRGRTRNSATTIRPATSCQARSIESFPLARPRKGDTRFSAPSCPPLRTACADRRRQRSIQEHHVVEWGSRIPALEQVARGVRGVQYLRRRSVGHRLLRRPVFPESPKTVSEGELHPALAIRMGRPSGVLLVSFEVGLRSSATSTTKRVVERHRWHPARVESDICDRPQNVGRNCVRCRTHST